MEPFFCRWLWHAATLLCDGTITCGLDDPFKLRNYGNIRNQSLQEIMAGAEVAKRRRDLLSGQGCKVCHLHTVIDDFNISQLAPSAPYPKKLVVESSIRCNIRCNNSVCNVANDSTFHVRSGDYLSWDDFKKALDEVGPYLDDLFFFNYGEPFINSRACDMLAYARKINPNMMITSSTNGLLLSRGNLAERIVEEGLVDWLCFTIGGVDEESYRKYHKSSSFEKAMDGMRRIIDAKRRLGRDKPIVHWRYLLFRWNDSDEQIAAAVKMADELGVDEFKLFMTGTPLEGRTLRRAPGTRGFDAIAEWLDYDAHFRVDPYAESGLWHPEDNAALGPFSWSGREARLIVTPEEGKSSIKLARPDFGLPDPEVIIRTPWATMQASVGCGIWANNEIPLPELAQDHPFVAEVVSAKPFVPLRHGVGLDGRELGVMIALDQVQPVPNPHRRDIVGGIGPRLREGC